MNNNHDPPKARAEFYPYALFQRNTNIQVKIFHSSLSLWSSNLALWVVTFVLSYCPALRSCPWGVLNMQRSKGQMMEGRWLSSPLIPGTGLNKCRCDSACNTYPFAWLSFMRCLISPNQSSSFMHSHISLYNPFYIISSLSSDLLLLLWSREYYIVIINISSV